MRHHYDLEAIKSALPVSRALELHGIPVHRNRARCPVVGVCGGKAGESFAIYAEGRAWTCHRCHEGGDVFDVLRHLEGGTIRQAINRAAALAGVDPGAPARPQCARREDPERQRRRLLSEDFRTTAAARDLARALASNPALSVETRADALSGARLLSRKLALLDRELAGDGDPAELQRLNRELEAVLERLEAMSREVASLRARLAKVGA